jgi:hypothetical protein
MSFTFKAIQPPPAQMIIPPEPPDLGGVGGSLNNTQNVQNSETMSKTNSISFRDKVLGTQSVKVRERIDLIANNLAQIELIKGNRLLPMLHVKSSVMEELSIPWKDALVVKLLGKSLGFNIMKTKLETIWALTGGIDLMDVGNSFYMVKFDGEEDKAKVINGGPWMIYDHYLAVRQWSPTFNAATAIIDKTMVWIRIPSLNLVYYDESLLWTLASMVGTPVKVDMHTLRVARGKFARMCVEIDLTQPVVGRVGINGEWYQVQYEGLHIICTQCGCYGHVLKDCISKQNKPATEAMGTTVADSGEQIRTVTQPEETVQKTVEEIMESDQSSINGAPESLHGDWIKVERKKKLIIK